MIKYDIEIRDLYLEIANAIFNPTRPTLVNTDGDRLEWTTMTYVFEGAGRRGGQAPAPARDGSSLGTHG